MSLVAPPPRLPEIVLGCPSCGFGLQGQREEQTCVGCKKTITLRLGCLADGAVVPPPFVPAEIKVKGSNMFTRTIAVVGQSDIRSGELDPITGRIPIGETAVAWNDIYTMSTWKRVDWKLLIVTAVFLGPLDVLLAGLMFESLFAVFFALPFWAWTGFAIRKAVKTGVRQMRVCGGRTILSFRYDTLGSKWRRFEAEAHKRAGIAS